MLYIHGGNYDHGSGNTFPGHMLAASQEVVVVTFNYRLGLLGINKFLLFWTFHAKTFIKLFNFLMIVFN